jgi:CRP-like cAMP-binding protein
LEEERAESEQDSLASIRFFSGASARGLARLSQRTEVVPYEPGQLIFSEGDRPTHLFVIKSGRVQVFRNYDGEEEVQRELGKGELLGELGILGGHGRSAAARALEPTQVWAIHREAFLELYEAEPAVSVEIATTLARYLLDADEVAEDLLGLDLEGRVAKRLLTLTRIEGGRVYVAGASEGMTQEEVRDRLRQVAQARNALEADFDNLDELALMSGGTRSTVAGILAGFERDGLVVTAEGNVIVIDADGLAQEAGLA